jgi:hypothetical protein
MEYKRFNEFVGNRGQDVKMNPIDYVTITSHIPKASAILRKNVKIKPNNCDQICNGLYQIN